MVFLALPALQRSQRDTARRQDVAKAVVAIQQYYADGGDSAGLVDQSCEDGILMPLASNAKLGPYLRNAGFSSSVTGEKIAQNCQSRGSWPMVGAITFYLGDRCGKPNTVSGGYDLVDTGSLYDAAVAIRMETGSDAGRDGAHVYCADAGR